MNWRVTMYQKLIAMKVIDELINKGSKLLSDPEVQASIQKLTEKIKADFPLKNISLKGTDSKTYQLDSEQYLLINVASQSIVGVYKTLEECNRNRSNLIRTMMEEALNCDVVTDTIEYIQENIRVKTVTGFIVN